MDIKQIPTQNDQKSRKFAGMASIDFANGKAGAWDLSGPRTDTGGFFTARLMRNSPARALTLRNRVHGGNHESMKNLAVNSTAIMPTRMLRNEALRQSMPIMDRAPQHDNRSQDSMGLRSTCDNTVDVSGKGISLLSNLKRPLAQNLECAGGDSTSASPRRTIGTSQMQRRSRPIPLHSVDAGLSPNIEQIQKRAQIWGNSGEPQSAMDVMGGGDGADMMYRTQQFGSLYTFDNAYKVPDRAKQTLPIKNVIIKDKPAKISFMDQHTARKKIIPPPDKYVKIDNWCPTQGPDARKGLFLKTARTTESERIFADGKKNPRPSPVTYQAHQNWQGLQPKTKGSYKVTEEVVNFTDEVVALKRAIPQVGKYNHINLEITKPRVEKWGIVNDKTLGSRLEKIGKNDSLSPTSYQTLEAFKSTQQTKKDKYCVFRKSQYPGFIDKQVTHAKKSPGVGHYKKCDSAVEMLGKSSLLKSRRH